jgi:putrescine aminotransferase
MPIAKALSSGYLPIGGVMVGDRVAGVLIAKGGEFFHGFTYSGTRSACAVAIANLRYPARAHGRAGARRGLRRLPRSALAQLADHPLVGEARTLGLLGALELVPDKARRRSSESGGKVGTLPRHLLRERPGDARGARHHDRRAAAGHHASRDRRAGREGLALAWT